MLRAEPGVEFGARWRVSPALHATRVERVAGMVGMEIIPGELGKLLDSHARRCKNSRPLTAAGVWSGKSPLRPSLTSSAARGGGDRNGSSVAHEVDAVELVAEALAGGERGLEITFSEQVSIDLAFSDDGGVAPPHRAR